MPNRKVLADKVREEYKNGLPDGLDEQFMRRMPVLFDRIRELERALTPFIRAQRANEQYPKELVEVYYKDLIRARDVMDPRQSTPLPVELPYYPAA
jgi:hypothetical protein